MGEGEGDEGRLSFFLKNLPNIFFGPLVGVELLSGSVSVGAGGDTGSPPPDESERADDPGVCTPSGPPGRGAACKTKSWCSSILVRLLDGGSRDADAVCEPKTSTGSSTARPRSSKPRFWNFATLASVPASTMTLVMTLCA